MFRALACSSILLCFAVLLTSGCEHKNVKVASKGQCATLNDIDNTWTPEDLYKSMMSCVHADDYFDADNLFAVAGTFSIYDGQRVAGDIRQQQAASVLQTIYLRSFSIEQQKDFAKIKTNNTGTKTLEENCKKLVVIGPPTYIPSYVLEYRWQDNADGSTTGVKAAPEGNIQFVESFDSKSAWIFALTKYLGCSAADIQ